MNEKEINELKDLCFEDPNKDVVDFKNLKDLKVEIIDHMVNPYRSMFEMATQTWGTPGKWEKASPELRFEIVKKVLERKALPLALEAPYFSFQIKNISRAAFDQISRTRIGVVYAARGFKDNYLNYIEMIIPEIYDEEEKEKIRKHFKEAKELYSHLSSKKPNWAARCVIPMYVNYNFIMVMNFSTLQKFCANRMETTEMQDTVATAWLMREEVKKTFPLLAEYLRPGCDWSRKDTTTNANGFAKELGVIHDTDNRWPGFEKEKYDVRYSEPCTDIKVIEKQCGITIPKTNEWIDYTWENLEEIDKKRFSN